MTLKDKFLKDVMIIDIAWFESMRDGTPTPMA